MSKILEDMNGISKSEFYDKLYYGADIDISYSAAFYHINSGYENGDIHSITVYQYDKHPDMEPSYYKEIYNRSGTDAAENIDNFLNAAIFEEKSFCQIDLDIEVIYV